MLESLACCQSLKGYDLTKQKSPGYSRAVSRICRNSMFPLYSADKPLLPPLPSHGASHRIFRSISVLENFSKRTGVEDVPSFSGPKVSYFCKYRSLRWERLRGRAAYDVADAVEVINDLGLDTLTFLAVTVLIMPTFKLIKASPILGFFCAGVVLNQFGLIRNIEDVKVLSEWGILFLLFEMGLELSLARLKALAKYAFGMGLAQVVLSTLAFTAFELPPNGAIGTKILQFLFNSRPDLVNIRSIDEAVVIGAALSLSSSAFVLQLLAEKGELPTRFGSATLGILLLQDLAVVPLLVILPVLESQNMTEGSIWPMLAQESLKALGGLGLLSFGGKYILRRVFEVVADTRSSEAFVALCLLTIAGTSLVTQKLGFSDTLGAFLAGAILAETNFRTQIEADIRPFRGLLLGLFFLITGTSIDMQLLLRFKMEMESVDEYEEVEKGLDQDCQSVEPSKKKAKIYKSEVWKHFTPKGLSDDGIERAECNHCRKLYKAGGKQYGTSHLKRHLEKTCEKFKSEDVGQLMLDMQGKLKNLKIDQAISREKCAKLLLRRDLPFKFVEFEELTDWLQYLNPDYVPITRNTAKADVVKFYIKEKAKLKEELANIPSRVSLTSDLWTSINTEGYISLTGHFVDTNLKLNSKILNFCHLPPPHTGFELAKKVNEFLVDWGIEKKICSLTLDNSSANDVLQQTLRSQLTLQKALLCNGEFFHVRCSAHILNLIVHEGLKVASKALEKIRSSIKHVKGSENRMVKFKECIEKVGNIDSSSGLVTDVPTRWNSTYLMLKSALKYRRVFENLHCYDGNYIDNPSKEEWSRAEKMSKFLLPFYEVTTLMSGTSYPTSNLYFLQVWKIQCLLIQSKDDEDEVIKIMAEKMMVKFDKYWEEYSIVLAFGTILDPRMKLDTLGICFEKIHPQTWELKVEKIKGKLYELFSEYSTKASSSKVSKSTQSSSNKSSEPSLFDEIKARRQRDATKTGKSQLDIYLDEAVLDLDFTEQMDVLQWWKNHSQRFPELSIMARDLLSIPITTVASESSFSIGSRVLNKYRNRLLSENVEALICSRNWLHAFNDDGGDDDNEDVNGEKTFSKSASNVVDLED